MIIPVFVVTGFLDAGKTTLLNQLLNRQDWCSIKMLVIQFETGEEEFQSLYQNCSNMVFPKKMLENQRNDIAVQIQNAVQAEGIGEIWIEWNGVVPFSDLQSLILDSSLCKICKIQNVIHIVDAENIENLLGKTGGALLQQIANSDIAVVRNACSRSALSRIRRLLKCLNPDIDIFRLTGKSSIYRLYKPIFREKEHPVYFFFVVTFMIIALHYAARPVLESYQIPVNTITNVFLGIILQAVPFLLIGILLSSAIQVFIPKSWIERCFPKSLGMGMLVAVTGGFLLPVCDCVSIPVFRSLVRKGIPLPVAVTFMTVSPVINPVVILSTYSAFHGDMTIVVCRVCLGILASILIGLIVAVWPPKGRVLSGGKLDMAMCSWGCYENAESVSGLSGRIKLFLRHSQAEFFNVGKYLMIGTFIASVFQVMGTGIFALAQRGTGLAVSISVMMAMAFILSLCSSSDAVIGRSFANQFPAGAVMGFLVFGPMMDIKNVMMLTSGFTIRFVGKLLFTTFMVCFAVVFFVYFQGV